MMNKSNMRRAILGQIYVVKAQLDSICIMLEELEEEEDKTCKHPLEYRDDYTTMGGPEIWKCKLCGYEYNEDDYIGKCDAKE